MTLNLPNWFIPRYNESVTLRYQQRDRRLAGVTSSGGSFIGDHMYYPRLGSAEMYDNARFAQLQLANAAQDWISVQAKPKFIAFGIWDPDKTKLSISAAAEYGRVAANAGMRAEDDMVIKALNSAAVNGVQGVDINNNALGAVENITTIGDYNTVADLDLITYGVQVLGSNEAFEGEDIAMAVPFKVKVNNSLDPYMVFSQVNDQDLPWSQINFRTSERLFNSDGNQITPANMGATTGVDMYLFARSAVVSDYNNEMTQIDERWGQALTDIMGNWFQGAAAVRDAKGVVRIKSKYNFQAARKALPFIAE